MQSRTVSWIRLVTISRKHDFVWFLKTIFIVPPIKNSFPFKNIFNQTFSIKSAQPRTNNPGFLMDRKLIFESIGFPFIKIAPTQKAELHFRTPCTDFPSAGTWYQDNHCRKSLQDFILLSADPLPEVRKNNLNKNHDILQTFFYKKCRKSRNKYLKIARKRRI